MTRQTWTHPIYRQSEDTTPEITPGLRALIDQNERALRRFNDLLAKAEKQLPAIQVPTQTFTGTKIQASTIASLERRVREIGDRQDKPVQVNGIRRQAERLQAQVDSLREQLAARPPPVPLEPRPPITRPETYKIEHGRDGISALVGTNARVDVQRDQHGEVVAVTKTPL